MSTLQSHKKVCNKVVDINEVTAAEAPIINKVNSAEAADINEVKTAESAEEKLPDIPTIKEKVEKGLI